MLGLGLDLEQKKDRLPALIASTVHTGAESLLVLVLGLGLGQDLALALAMDPPNITKMNVCIRYLPTLQFRYIERGNDLLMSIES